MEHPFDFYGGNCGMVRGKIIKTKLLLIFGGKCSLLWYMDMHIKQNPIP